MRVPTATGRYHTYRYRMIRTVHKISADCLCFAGTYVRTGMDSGTDVICTTQREVAKGRTTPHLLYLNLTKVPSLIKPQSIERDYVMYGTVQSETFTCARLMTYDSSSEDIRYLKI